MQMRRDFLVLQNQDCFEQARNTCRCFKMTDICFD
jgi:hypothetical protein